MGDRAVITASKNLDGMGLYLHWDGYRSFVEGALAYCKMKGYRSPDYCDYGWTMLACVVANYFGDGLSCGVDTCDNLDCDNYDNGVYIIKDWLIVGRKYKRFEERCIIPLRQVIERIDEEQPERMRLTAKEWEMFGEVNKAVLAAREEKGK